MIRRSVVKRVLKYVLTLAVVAFVVIQLVPYGRDHANPPVIAEPGWDIPATRELAVRACFDCHSNEVHWPWYSNVAPLSWWVQDHVDEGRDELNFSEWPSGGDEADEIAESVIEGEMPPWYYKFAPGSRNLSARERELLIAGLVTTFGGSGERNGSRDDEDDDDDD